MASPSFKDISKKGMIRLRYFAALLLSGLACLILASCMNTSLLPDNADRKADESEPDRRVTLEFWHTYSDLETEVFEQKVLPLFETQYPDIRIHAVRKDYTNQLKDNVLAAAADNKQPDVMRIDMIWVPELAHNGALADLSEMEGFDRLRDQFIGALINTNLYRGKYYGLPVNANTKAAIFNVKALARAGLTAPPRTFEELEQATQRIRQTDPDFYGMGICCSTSWGTLPYFWTFGGKLMDDNYTTASGYLDSPDSVKAIAKLKRLYDEHIINPSPSILTEGEADNWSGILKGNLLMIDEAHWFYTVNSTDANKPLLKDTVVGMIPSDVRSGTSIIGGENLVLFQASKHPAEAWQFMQWMTTEQPQRLMAETGLIPTIVNLQHTVDLNPLFTPYLQQLGNALPRPSVPRWSDIDNLFARMMERIMSGERPINDEIADTTRSIDALLKSP